MARQAIDGFLAGTLISIVPFDEQQAILARDAFMRFGKGRHEAALNFRRPDRSVILICFNQNFVIAGLVPATHCKAPLRLETNIATLRRNLCREFMAQSAPRFSMGRRNKSGDDKWWESLDRLQGTAR